MPNSDIIGVVEFYEAVFARRSDARCFVLSDFNWPHAAIMSRPRGTRTGEEYPASFTILANRWIALLLEQI